MAKVEEYDMPDELYYHKKHIWVRVEGDEDKEYSENREIVYFKAST